MLLPLPQASREWLLVALQAIVFTIVVHLTMSAIFGMMDVKYNSPDIQESLGERSDPHTGVFNRDFT